MAEYKEAEKEMPEDARAEVMLLAGNSQRQLGHTKEADEIYRRDHRQVSGEEEAKDAQYQRLINIYNSNPPTLIAESMIMLIRIPPRNAPIRRNC